MRALARSERAAAAVRELGAEPAPGDLTANAMAAGADGAAVAFHLAAHLGQWGPRTEFERGNGHRHGERARCMCPGGRRALRALRHGGRADGRRAARERGRERATPAGLEPSTRRPRRRPRRRCSARTGRASQPCPCVRASCGGRGTRRSYPGSWPPSRAAASLGSAAAVIARHDPCRQRGRGASARRGARSSRRGLLRHRRRAGRLSSVRLRADLHPGLAAGPLAAGLGGAGAWPPPPSSRGGACR